MPLFNSAHFQVLYELVYGPSPYLSKASAREIVSTLRSDATALVTIAGLLRRFTPPSSQPIRSLLTTPFLSRLLPYRARAHLERSLIPEFQSYLQCVLNSLTLLSDIATFSGLPDTTFTPFFEACDLIRSDLESAMAVKLEITVPEHHNIRPLLPKVIEQVLESRKTELKATDDRLMDLRFKNHTCTVCRFQPAIYFVEPCMHPCVCHACMRNLAELKSAITHCYACQQKVTRIRPFSYFIE
jgi:hypothetical protein